MHMSWSPTIVARKQIEASNAGKTLWRSKWGSFATVFCRDQCWIGIDVGTGRYRLGQMSWIQGNGIPSETSTLSEVAKRWLLSDLSKLQTKLIILVKPLICALNLALNLDKPLTASRLVIKALGEYTDISQTFSGVKYSVLALLANWSLLANLSLWHLFFLWCLMHFAISFG